MGNVNKVLLLGRLGEDMVLRHTPNNDPVGNVSMATSETWKDKNTGDRKERTEWHRLVIWGQRAEGLKQYLTKGKEIFVEGRLQTRKWEAKDGSSRYTTEIRVDNLEFVSGSRSSGERSGPNDTTSDYQGKPASQLEADPPKELTEDDIPF